MTNTWTSEEAAAVKRVAVYRIGHIGDMAVAMPSFWTLRKFFPNARITLFTKSRHVGTLAQSTDVMRMGTAFDDALTYRYEGGLLGKLKLVKTLLQLRKEKFDVLAYLPTDDRSEAQLARDEKFFGLAGIKRIVGLQGRREIDYRDRSKPLPWTKHEVDILLGYLARDGVSVPTPASEMFDFAFTPEELAFSLQLAAEYRKGTRPLIAVTPRSKMPAKDWPTERYRTVLHALRDEFDPVFVTFGAGSDRESCAEVLDGLPDAQNSAGELTVRQSAALLAHCDMYLGADTGVLHMAAAVGTKCVGIFSARDWPGRWYAYGEGHITFRKVVPCEGCLLEVCPYENRCMKLIEAPEVIEAARTQLLSLSFSPVTT